MGFFRRLLGGTPSESTEATTPSSASVVAVSGGIVYVDPSCPHCGHRFDPPPSRKRKCPACGEPVVYDRGFDELVRLVRPGEETRDRDWEREQTAKQAHYSGDPRPLRKMNEERLRTYRSLGVRVGVVNADSNRIVIGGDDVIPPGASSCAPCKKAVGVYDARSAPLLPLADCRSKPIGLCSCRYQPIAP